MKVKIFTFFLFLFINSAFSQMQLQLEKIISLNDTADIVEKKIRPIDLFIDTISQKLYIYSYLFLQKIGNTILIYNPQNDNIKKIYDTAYFSWGDHQSLLAEGDTIYLYIRNHELSRYDILKFINYELQNRMIIPLQSSALALAKYDSLFLTIEVPEFNHETSNVVFLNKEFQIIKKIPLGRFAGWKSRLHPKNDFLYYSSNSTSVFFVHAQKINLKTGEIVYNVNTPEDTLKSFSNYSVLDKKENLYIAGTKFDGSFQKFYLYKISKNGIIEWYREFFPSDYPFKRRNLGNWLNCIETFENYVIVGGEVEEFPPTHPKYDPNQRSSYIAIFDIDGQLVKEIFFDKYNYPKYSIDGVWGVKFYKNKLFVLIVALLFNGFYVYAIDNYLYVYNIITNVDNEDKKPETYNLFQNYPNPFNSSTTIKFTLPKTTKVTLKVYNILGQEVATIIDEKELPAGYHDYEFNANKLTSGTYIYKIVAGNFVQTKKMVLIK